MTVLRLFGVRLVLTRSFLALLALLAVAGLLREAALLFGVVIMHELAHAAAARWYGLGVAQVELLPFGGVARLEGAIELYPAIEAKVALAGPLSNLAAMAMALAAVQAGLLAPNAGMLFVEVNALIGGFNLIPALPLDGGRVVRAWLARRVGIRRATERAARAGAWCGLAMCAVGLPLAFTGYVSVSMVAVGLFLVVAATREEEQAAFAFMRYLARRREELRLEAGVSARQIVAGEQTPVKDVLDMFVPQVYHVVWVLGRDGRLAGIAGEVEVIDAMFEHGIETPLGRVATPLR